MKSLIGVCMFCFFIATSVVPISIVCAPGSEKPEKVYSIVFVQKPDEWYVKQQKLWKQEIDANPENAEAWRNYYNAVRYHRFGETIHTESKKEQLNSILEKMEKYVAESYEYYYLKNKTAGSLTDATYLLKAYELRPNEPEIYSDLVAYYEFQGNNRKTREFLKKWYDSQDMAPGLINYNYNVLASTAENAILFSNGDNDTYPVWMLQQVKNFRPDVTLLNASLIQADKKYLERKCNAKGIKLDYDQLPAYPSKEFVPALVEYIQSRYPEIPVYMALTMYSNYTDPIKEKLYIVGLAYLYSEHRVDNIALIRKNLENHFHLDYLDFTWYGENYLASGIVDKLNMNYVAGMVILAEHYQKSGLPDLARKWAQKALSIAEKGGVGDQMLKDLEKKGIHL